MNTVYTLLSTRNSEVRYVGQTTQRLASRLRQHRSDANVRCTTPVRKWIAREEAAGFQIIITSVVEDAILHQTEIELISQYRALGVRLLNVTDGGEGTIGWHGNLGNKRPDLAERNRAQAGKPGRTLTDETKAKISAAHKGKKKPHLAERNRAGAGKPGHKHTDASRAKIGAAHKGRRHSVESRQKMSTAKAGRKLSPEAIAKLREGHRRYYQEVRA